MYYNARYYDPAIGQFISPDTIVPDPSNVLDYNRYMYVRGNPIKYNDPSGHSINLPCFICTLDQSYDGLAKTTNDVAADLVAHAVCFFAGCHVDTESNRVTGPTKEEWAQAQAHSLISMGLVPMGSVISRPLSNLGTVKVFRVEGSVNSRIRILDGGLVNITSQGKMLFLNFGDEKRALEFFEKRVAQGMEDIKIKSFEVDAKFLDYLREIAVPEQLSREFPNSPLVVDITKAADQYGLKREHINTLIEYIVDGTGKIE